jgi:hypothetical protein
MSSKQGPHAVGMRTPATAVGSRHLGAQYNEGHDGGDRMSSKQGPHAVGMCTPATAVGSRQRCAEFMYHLTEAT